MQAFLKALIAGSTTVFYFKYQIFKKMKNQPPVAHPATTTAHTRSKTIDAQSALSILKEFYTECRKEFRKLDKVNTFFSTDNEISSLHFIADGFDLNLVIKEGGTV
jgi:hypothetical protein